MSNDKPFTHDLTHLPPAESGDVLRVHFRADLSDGTTVDLGSKVIHQEGRTVMHRQAQSEEPVELVSFNGAVREQGTVTPITDKEWPPLFRCVGCERHFGLDESGARTRPIAPERVGYVHDIANWRCVGCGGLAPEGTSCTCPAGARDPHCPIGEHRNGPPDGRLFLVTGKATP